MVHRVRTPTRLFASFVNLCIDAITQAIYRAYDDKADISECRCLMFS